ncbi:MAG: response regulator transcription factor [Pseudohongiella sp.]|nr:response regulator transcription factor [Pseudohongiella sp.]MDP2128695.1 response regulator transcription factor [Pseudohongiella sp.]
MWDSQCEHNGKAQALVLEDNPETRAWLSSCVNSAFPELLVHLAANLAEAMILLETQRFDLALVDLGLPDGSGMDVIRALYSGQPQCYVVVATIYDDDRNLFAALKSGAKGYILKDQDRARIVSYLQGIKKNQPPLSPASSQRLINHFNNKATALAQAKLTPREVEVLCLIGKGYSVEDAAGMLQLSADTVKGYVKTIYIKLGVSNRSEATLEAIRLGLIDVN